MAHIISEFINNCLKTPNKFKVTILIKSNHGKKNVTFAFHKINGIAECEMFNGKQTNR